VPDGVSPADYGLAYASEGKAGGFVPRRSVSGLEALREEAES